MVLSADAFDFTKIMDENGDSQGAATIAFASRVHVTEDCFEKLIRHPKVNVNAVEGDGRTLLIELLYSFGYFIMINQVEEANCSVQCIISLLKAGTDPCIINPRDGHSPTWECLLRILVVLCV